MSLWSCRPQPLPRRSSRSRARIKTSDDSGKMLQYAVESAWSSEQTNKQKFKVLNSERGLQYGYQPRLCSFINPSHKNRKNMWSLLT